MPLVLVLASEFTDDMADDRSLTPDLPRGLTTRPLQPSDQRAVYELMAASERAMVGEAMIEEADIVADWQRPGFDLATSSIGVVEGDRLVGYAEHSGGDRVDAAVHPDELERGIGTWLARWLQATALQAGQAEIGMPVPAGSVADRLLADLGYHVRYTSWGLELPSGTSVPARPLPDGFTVRAAEADEYPLVSDVIENAFGEWSNRPRSTFEEFDAAILRRPGFEPWNLRVVVDPDGDVVGAGLIMLAGDGQEGWIDKLAVRRDQRGRGLAQALLVDAFWQAREHGATRSTLATDSRTGALGLYERVGMEVTSTWLNRGIRLAG
ncbi:GNAT family N-acetyltransferase [Euzebya tangerina]|uniref:GNAT family N-acetyltransferase n=1 Tax=Euzebya tangerina TaxID=591198 RepID=UPI00196AA422|nr:GNAT family N-acetyltransferase [Euzebya tangerina]